MPAAPPLHVAQVGRDVLALSGVLLQGRAYGRSSQTLLGIVLQHALARELRVAHQPGALRLGDAQKPCHAVKADDGAACVVEAVGSGVEHAIDDPPGFLAPDAGKVRRQRHPLGIVPIDGTARLHALQRGKDRRAEPLQVSRALQDREQPVSPRAFPRRVDGEALQASVEQFVPQSIGAEVAHVQVSPAQPFAQGIAELWLCQGLHCCLPACSLNSSINAPNC